MPWLIDDACLLASMYDTPLLHAEDITTIYNFCEEQFAEDEESFAFSSSAGLLFNVN